jgi:ABC-type transport system substrate-binding protein/class 3 adenylate cyclase/DNA-binding beta-propeller fold protein YncE
MCSNGHRRRSGLGIAWSAAHDTRMVGDDRSIDGSGDVRIRTFLIADIRGYTLFTQERGDESAGKLAATFARIAREGVEGRGGRLLELRGDEAMCVFGSARQAIRAAAELQERFVEETLADPNLPLTVGIGIDAGEAVEVEGGYRGGALNLAARLCGQARAGEILASREVAHLARRVDGVRYEDGGALTLKGMAEPVHVVRVSPEGVDTVARLQPYAPVRPPEPQSRRPPWPVIAAAAIALSLVAVAIPLLNSGPSVHVRSNSVARLSADGGRVELATPLGDRLGASAVGFGSVWVVQPDRDRVVRVDPTDGEIEDRIEVGGSPSAIAIGAGSVWVTNAADGTVSRISPETNAAGEPLLAGSRPTGIAFGGGAVWVADSLTGSLRKIDPGTGRTTGERDLPGLPSGVAYTDDGVWVAMAPADVARVDPDDLEIAVTRSVGIGPAAVLPAFGSIWVANRLDGTVSRLDPSTANTLSQIRVGDGPNGLAESAGSVWVTTEYDGVVTPIDPDSDTKGEAVAVGVTFGSVVASGDDLWLAAAASLTEHRGGTLTVASSSSMPSTLDPAIVYAEFGAQILVHTNDGLLAFEKVGGPSGTTLVPNLASAFPEISPDGLTYRFPLREGIRYSTGEPVRPEDFRHGLERALALSGVAAIHYGALVGADRCDFEAGTCDLSEGIEASDGSVTFHLSRPDGDFPFRLALPFAAPLPASVPFEDQGLNPVPATGPYRIASIEGDVIELARNPEFEQWSGAAQPDGFVDSVVWRMGVNQTSALSQIASNDLDWFNEPEPSDGLAQLEAAHPDQVIDAPQAFTLFVGFDLRSAPMSDVRVRRAVNFAIDRELVIGNFLGGPIRQRPTCQIIPPNFQGYERFCPYTLAPERDVWSAPDVQRARALVRAAGAVDERVRVWITDDPGAFPAGVRAVDTMTYITSVLNEIGLRAELTVVSLDRYFGTLYGGQPPGVGGPPQTYLSGWISDYPGGGDFIETQFTCGGGVNVSGYCNRRLDRLIEQAKALQATDPAEANRTWTQVEHALVRDAVWAPLSNPVTTHAFSSSVENVQIHPQWGPLLSRMWVR